MPTNGNGQFDYPESDLLSGEMRKAGGTNGESTYRKLLTAFRKSSAIGTVPSDGERFGITTGSAEEWARFGTAVAKAESGFNPRVKNLSDPGGSFGIFQYAHNQVPGGNAYNVDASIKAFVRDAESSAEAGTLRGGILGQRFSTIGSHPERIAKHLGEAGEAPSEAMGKARARREGIPEDAGEPTTSSKKSDMSAFDTGPDVTPLSGSVPIFKFGRSKVLT